jgi:hypothetical protein
MFFASYCDSVGVYVEAHKFIILEIITKKSLRNIYLMSNMLYKRWIIYWRWIINIQGIIWRTIKSNISWAKHFLESKRWIVWLKSSKPFDAFMKNSARNKTNIINVNFLIWYTGILCWICIIINIIPTNMQLASTPI